MFLLSHCIYQQMMRCKSILHILKDANILLASPHSVNVVYLRSPVDFCRLC